MPQCQMDQDLTLDIPPPAREGRPEKRKFTAAIRVRIGTRRIRLELCPAAAHGGPPGFYRIRAARRWVGGAGGEMLFFDRARLATFLVEMVFDGFDPGISRAQYPQPPDIPRRSLVSVKFWHKGKPRSEQTRTDTPPIRAYDGHWYVGVMTYAAGFIFVPVKDLGLRERPCSFAKEIKYGQKPV